MYACGVGFDDTFVICCCFGQSDAAIFEPKALADHLGDAGKAFWHNSVRLDEPRVSCRQLMVGLVLVLYGIFCFELRFWARICSAPVTKMSTTTETHFPFSFFDNSCDHKLLLSFVCIPVIVVLQ